MYWLQAITPLHVGSGKGIGFIDMPIIREKVTNWPFVPGSAVKGVLRDHFAQPHTPPISDEKISAAFGKPGTDITSNAGSLVLTDAHIVSMPIRSLYGTFAYVTSPMVLARLRRDLEAAGASNLPQNISSSDDLKVYSTTGSKIVFGNNPARIFFEDLDFTAITNNQDTDRWADYISGKIFSDPAWQTTFKERFAIVSDNTFSFLAVQGSEVSAHIKIDETRKIVKRGTLWYEEALPCETILAGIAWCDRVYRKGITQQDIVDTFCPKELNLQIGGKATVGKGRVRCLFT
jgi:CRISPR-associated protein Cmr4